MYSLNWARLGTVTVLPPAPPVTAMTTLAKPITLKSGVEAMELVGAERAGMTQASNTAIPRAFILMDNSALTSVVSSRTAT
jgi:hypothetical protein